jgi:hypothetical protein
VYRIRESRQLHQSLACDLAAAGLAVFPARIWRDESGKWHKVPCIKGWRTGAGFEREQVAKWWRQFPDAIPGIELEAASLIVLDPDRHPGAPDGVSAFDLLRRPQPASASGHVHAGSRLPSLLSAAPQAAGLRLGRAAAWD